MRNWFLNLRTGTKLFIAFSSALLIAILVGIAGFLSVDRLYGDAQRVNTISRGALTAVMRVRLTAEHAMRYLFKRDPSALEAPAAGDPAAPPGPRVEEKDRPLTSEEWEGLRSRAKTLLSQAQLVIGSKDDILASARESIEALEVGSGGAGIDAGAESTTTLEKISGAMNALVDDSAHLSNLLADAAPGTEPRVLMFAESREAVARLLDDAAKLEGQFDSLSAHAIKRMVDTQDWGKKIMLGGAAAGVLLAVLVGLLTTRMIVDPLTVMTAAAHRISEGDLAADIDHVSRDEVGGLADSFRRMQGSLRDLSAEAQRVASGDLTRSVRGGGELGESFNRMVESLSALLREIQEAGTQVKSSSAKIHGNLQRNAEGSREEAAAVERVQQSMETLTETARSIATGAADVERTAGDAARVASQGTASVGAALEGMFRTREKVNEIAQKTMVLGEKCRRIGEVLKIIRDVAGEIHMLALNAAIESAASAGEHGRRFTVVAAEVRRLAERTRQSAEEIRSILIEIQEAAEATVGAAESGAREVEAGSAVAGSARTALEEVIARIHQTSEVAREISRATQEQRQSSEQVASSMRDISRAVRRMAEGTEESTRAVRELTDLSERFGDLMGTFRTG
ncbi:MAG: methyl-accepting chemotaxis protein [Planctomycetaceae bacterium]|nr:methyl-accepting chemotaxis protein [Planctomycetota bacterium]NUN52207.1 methyl-accepting chemotaxis protein [Planctomycetaceae bacterium]